MQIDKARRIFENTKTDYTRSRRFMQGIEIIEQVVDDIDKEIAAEHDIFYCGSFEEVIEKLLEKEVRKLAQFGWFESEDSLAFFV